MNNNIINNIFICATEQSGDNIGEKIIRKLSLNRTQKYSFDGIGGSKMLPLMSNQFYKLDDFKSIGIFEIIGSINKYLTIIENLANIIISNNYKIIITIDSPDFNYRVVKKIKKRGYQGKIIQIVAPTVWAWRASRAKSFSKYFDKILTIYPFENQYFKQYNLSSTFIGNPIYYINNIAKKNGKYIAFLPGSREREIISLIKYFKVASDYLNLISSNKVIFIPTLPHLKKLLINLTNEWNRKPIIETDNKKIELLFSRTYCAIVCSGTASLEIAKRKIPQIIIYKLNYFTFILLNFLVKIKFANIINIMANQMIIPEIINNKLDQINFLNNFKILINNPNNINEIQIKKSNYYIKKLVLEKSPAEIAVNEIIKLLFLTKAN